jgi:hypothetical protein
MHQLNLPSNAAFFHSLVPNTGICENEFQKCTYLYVNIVDGLKIFSQCKKKNYIFDMGRSLS